MIVQIPTNHNFRHLAEAAYQAIDDLEDNVITLEEALVHFGPFSEISDRMFERETPTGKEINL